MHEIRTFDVSSLLTPRVVVCEKNKQMYPIHTLRGWKHIKRLIHTLRGFIPLALQGCIITHLCVACPSDINLPNTLSHTASTQH